MFTANQFVAHLVGDYLLQSHWMATKKVQRWVPAFAHGFSYSVPFLFFRPSLVALSVIIVSHVYIDRLRLAKYVCWGKNFIAPFRFRQMVPETVWHDDPRLEAPVGYRPLPWGPIDLTTPNPSYSETRDNFGFPADTPPWMAFWLMVIVDNTMHILINGAALRWL